jgi:hypothetical protein
MYFLFTGSSGTLLVCVMKNENVVMASAHLLGPQRPQIKEGAGKGGGLMLCGM